MILEKYPLMKLTFEYVNKKYFLFHKTYNYIINFFDEDYLRFCEEILSIFTKMCKKEENYFKALDAFIEFSTMYLYLQAKLEREGKYLYSTFDEINKNVYQTQTMNEFYLDGLFLSQILWPNHYKFGQYFIDNKNLTNSESIVLDIPCGEGIYSYYLARFFKFKELHLIDISPYSLSYTEDLLKCASLFDNKRISLQLEDVFRLTYFKKYDFIACGELLEHIENPDELLKKLRDILKDDGALFITTAIYSAAIDHIYLFKTVDEVKKLIGKYFQIISEKILPTSLLEYNSGMINVSISYGALLKKIAD